MRVSDFKLADREHDLLSRIEGFNCTRREYDQDRSFAEILETRMRAAGNAMAVIGDEDSLTYEQLLEVSGRIASWFSGLPERPRRVAAVMMENTPAMIAAVAGTMRAGAIYLPVNP